MGDDEVAVMQQLEKLHQWLRGISSVSCRFRVSKLFPFFGESLETQRIICTGNAREKEDADEKKSSRLSAGRFPGLLSKLLQLGNAQSKNTSNCNSEPQPIEEGAYVHL